MQTLLLPAACSGVALSAPPFSSRIAKFLPCYLHRPLISSYATPKLRSSLSSVKLSSVKSLQFLSSPNLILKNYGRNTLASSPIAAASSSPSDDSEKAKLAQVSKRLESTSRYFKRLGGLGFWGQLVCTVVAAVILSFSVVITGKVTSPATFYATAGGIAAAFVSVFWSFGYIRLSDKLRKTANDPSKTDGVKKSKTCLRAFVHITFGGNGPSTHELSSSSFKHKPSLSNSSQPVLALDVFLVQASANTILSHFLGLVFSLELLRSVTLPPSESVPVFKTA
ncbi:TIC 21, chloroplastic [Olea europaea subsp. europaea]|uniref:TIC 21, chloroplastic n=1 Tax=Olea europaea subsp. europaea TaxID=158383 RepID=A0A8S0U1E4_OLEEU|nr:TIC 21, chloroplastic [Olea europaea subsp. europaea]